jgi:hypothetical protein
VAVRRAPAGLRDAGFASVRELPLDEANARVLSEVFGGMDARAALPGVLDACTAFRPDVGWRRDVRTRADHGPGRDARR